MRIRENGRPTWRAPAGALALLVLVAGAAQAAGPSSMSHYFSSHPMISGTVVSVNDHQMVVNTDQGEQVTLELDTRTMAPRDLGPGMVMRADFKALEDCRLYAQAIMPVRGSASTERTQVYANTHDSPEVVARNATAADDHRRVTWEVAGHRSLATTPQAMDEHSPGATMTATPGTFDYLQSTRPMISGRVVAVNDHRLVVRTHQGQQVGMVMDSQTMLPGTVAPGTFVRTEFTRLKDGRYYAKAVSLAGARVTEREQAYAHTVDSDIRIAENVPECGAVYAGDGRPTTMTVEPRETRVSSEPMLVSSGPVKESLLAQNDPAPLAEPSQTLPQTASNQPLLLLLGTLALGAAVVVGFFRRLLAA